jgi:uncharacterized protein (UPF0147 family)
VSDDRSGSVATTAPRESAAIPERDTAREVGEMLATLHELSEDLSVPRNIRRGALEARAELERRGTAADVRIAGAVHRLDELANDPNLPIHGRTTIWSILSRLESLP